jgi:GH15 family glucan-1,4-alpha-glucosidase
MASRIEDHALIGDCETAAFVGRDGSTDWLSFPRFDSAACFAALLGTLDHGRWVLRPKWRSRESNFGIDLGRSKRCVSVFARGSSDLAHFTVTAGERVPLAARSCFPRCSSIGCCGSAG